MAAYAEVESAIRAMPEKRRGVVVMRQMEELSTEATADALGASEEVVKTRMRRDRTWLRERLAGYFSLKAPPLDDLNHD